MTKLIPSAIDVEHLALLRQNVSDFMRACAKQYGTTPGRLLDIAPQIHEGAAPFFSHLMSVIETLDIDPSARPTYVADITQYNAAIPDGCFDYVVCTEVLEHTLNPFSAAAEIYRILRPGGYLFVSVPFNFRIHGPLPDCWRFTEHGLRALLSQYMIIELSALETPDRPLMPIHYTVVARKYHSGG